MFGGFGYASLDSYNYGNQQRDYSDRLDRQCEEEDLDCLEASQKEQTLGVLGFFIVLCIFFGCISVCCCRKFKKCCFKIKVPVKKFESDSSDKEDKKKKKEHDEEDKKAQHDHDQEAEDKK